MREGLLYGQSKGSRYPQQRSCAGLRERNMASLREKLLEVLAAQGRTTTISSGSEQGARRSEIFEALSPSPSCYFWPLTGGG
jgi:hypothetical protein